MNGLVGIEILDGLWEEVLHESAASLHGARQDGVW